MLETDSILNGTPTPSDVFSVVGVMAGYFARIEELLENSYASLPDGELKNFVTEMKKQDEEMDATGGEIPNAGKPSFTPGQTVYSIYGIYGRDFPEGNFLPDSLVVGQDVALEVIGYPSPSAAPLRVKVRTSLGGAGITVLESKLTAHVAPSDGYDSHIDELLNKGDANLNDDDRRYLGRSIGFDYDKQESY